MPLTILVTDDDEGTRLSISEYLSLAGYSVVSAQDGREALSRLETHQPHLIITDISMPGLDGYGLIQQVRQRPQYRLLPVIFLTARTETAARIKGYQMGCDVYLPKPFELPELAAIVRNLLERMQIIQSVWVQSAGMNQATIGEAQPKTGTVTTLESPSVDFELTQREQDVLTLLAEGLSNVQIGDRLFLSHRTIEKYVSNLLRKTDANNRAELVRFAIDHNLL
ncbi:MAG: response regulator transcription factor [Cyanobacteria bacterium P01_H01_bin.119]